MTQRFRHDPIDDGPGRDDEEPGLLSQAASLWRTWLVLVAMVAAGIYTFTRPELFGSGFFYEGLFGVAALAALVHAARELGGPGILRSIR